VHAPVLARDLLPALRRPLDGAAIAAAVNVIGSRLGARSAPV
jgi:hypothetical protein